MEHCSLVVRARSDRRLPNEPRTLFCTMAHTPPCGTMAVTIGRVTERRDNAGNIVVKGHPETDAEVDVIFRRVTLAPPSEKPEAGPVSVVCVTAAERGMPKDREPVRWHLLTTLDVKDAEDARKVIRYYECRWVIEECTECSRRTAATSRRSPAGPRRRLKMRSPSTWWWPGG